MARYTGPKDRLSRREAFDIFGKGAKLTRITVPPGVHGPKGLTKRSQYGRQLREKQKVKRIYGVMEAQFRRYIDAALNTKGNTGEKLISLLERRLDNVLCLVSFAGSRKSARQLIRHGHITVNDKKVDIASYLVKVGDVIKPKNTETNLNIVKANIELLKGRNIPAWIEFKAEIPEAVVTQLPAREDISVPVQEQLIVELCSK